MSDQPERLLRLPEPRPPTPTSYLGGSGPDTDTGCDLLGQAALIVLAICVLAVVGMTLATEIRDRVAWSTCQAAGFDDVWVSRQAWCVQADPFILVPIDQVIGQVDGLNPGWMPGRQPERNGDQDA